MGRLYQPCLAVSWTDNSIYSVTSRTREVYGVNGVTRLRRPGGMLARLVSGRGIGSAIGCARNARVVGRGRVSFGRRVVGGR